MFRILTAAAVGGFLALFGYGIGWLVADAQIWAVALAAVGFALGVALASMVATTSLQSGEEPTKEK